MSKVKTERLTALALLLLSTRRPLTKEQIGQFVGEYNTSDRASFERQFERDKNDLRDLGLDIEAVDASDPESAAYIADQAGSFLPPISLDADEKLLLAMAAGLWSDADWGRASRSALTKLEAAGGETIPAAVSAVGSTVTRSEAVDAIISARGAGQRIAFDYRKPRQAATERRTVEPWGCVIRGDRWFLVGRDVDRDAVRVFRLSRIEGSVTAVGRPGVFRVPPETSVAAEVQAVLARDPVGTAQLSLAPGRSPALRRLCESTGTRGGEDLLCLPYRDPDWASRTILVAGDAARVLGPDDVAARVRSAAAAVVQLHADAPSPLPPAAGVARQQRKTPAPERVGRILSMVAWVRSRGGRAALPDVAAHFGASEEAIANDVELAACTEFGPYHDTLDVELTRGGFVTVRDAQGADRPVSLSTAEALPLVMGLAMLEAFAPVSDTDLFSRTRAKLVTSVGSSAGLAGIALAQVDETDPEVVVAVDTALTQARVLELDYLSLGQDREVSSVVHPIASRIAAGHRYLQAWEPSVGEVYVRLDRVTRCRIGEAPSQPPPDVPVTTVVSGRLRGFGARAEVLLSPAGREFAETIPCEEIAPLAGGFTRVVVATSRPEWLARAVLAEGGTAEVISPQGLRDLTRRMAEGFLARQDGSAT
jgi:predicted DNA-binding transcriptional regulator YafY